MQTREEAFVRTAATALDAVRPGWFRSVDVTDLQMMSCTRCILGQVFGGWSEGLVALGMKEPNGELDADRLVNTYGESFSGGKLAPLWVHEIAVRLFPDLCSQEAHAQAGTVDAVARTPEVSACLSVRV